MKDINALIKKVERYKLVQTKQTLLITSNRGPKIELQKQEAIDIMMCNVTTLNPDNHTDWKSSFEYVWYDLKV